VWIIKENEMGFLEWLFGRKKAGVDKDMLFHAKELRDKYDKTVSDKFGYDRSMFEGLNNVPKWCHAGKKGKVIVCPHCGHNDTVYQFSWSIRSCSGCKEEVYKYDWFLGPDDE
tara:strand:+ start:342 stop:680 length:339 start_codon:yes stop_codon:yes gene_type:complete